MRSPAGAEPARRPDDAREMSVISRVAPFLWPKDEPAVRARVALAVAFLLLAKVATVGSPLLFGLAVDAFEGAAGREAALLSIPVWLTLAYGLARFGATAFNQARDAVFAMVGQRALRRIALTAFQHVHALSLRFHLQRKTGGLSRVIDRGVKGVDFLLRFLLFSIGPLVLELLMVAALLLVLFDWRFCVVVLATMALYVWFTLAVTEWRLKIRERMNRQDEDAAQKSVDSLLNFETVKYFTAEAREARRYDDAMAGYEAAAIVTATSLAWLNLGQAAILTIGTALVMSMAALEALAGRMTVGDFVMVNAYMIQLAMPLNFLGTVYREIRQSLVDMRAMFGLLDQPAEIRDAPDARPLAAGPGVVRFDHVDFDYDPDRKILKDVSFTVEGGRTLAVVGPSGAGKSTISRLLFRFYDATAGSVSIDGQDVRGLTQRSLRAALGVVPQDTVLFNDTIGYNIAYGADGATQAQIEAAARAASIHDFIAALPKGYDTQVGERGLKLSGGEKQRVAIARTILKNPPILILDEATSALDSQTERDIQDALRALGRDRTVIMIAHRLSTVVDADEIVVLDAGRVIERGRHHELLSRGGRYAAMWRLQESESEAA